MRIPIPRFQRQVDPGVSAPAALASGVPMSGMQDLGNALSGIGQMRERNAEVAQQRFLALEHEQMKSRVLAKVSEDRLKWTQAFEERKLNADPAADDLTPSVLKDFDTYREAATKGIADEEERRIYDGMLLRLREGLGVDAMTFQARQRTTYRKQVLTNGIDTDARVLAMAPEQFSDVLDLRLSAIRDSTDLPAADKQALFERTRDLLSFTAAQTMVERDPRGWLASVATPESAARHPVLANIPPERLGQISNHARALVAREDAKAQAELDKRLREAEEEMGTLRSFVLSGAPLDMAYQDKVRRLTVGTPFEAGAGALIEQASKGAAFGAQSLPRQAELLRAHESRATTLGTSPDESKLIQHARTIHETQSREYKENPWAAATRFGGEPAEPEVSIARADQVPQLVAQRLGRIGTVETLTGYPVSPLQPAEAQQFAAALKAMLPQQRAEVIGQTGAMLDIGRISALSAQLDKSDKTLALALKLGADRTTAGRATSALVLRGAQALADKAVKRDDMALSGWRAEIAGMVRGALGDDQAEQDVIDAAYYVRAAMDVEGIEVPGFNLKASNENAVRMVIGQPIERGGVKTILPRGMTESQFDERAKAALQPFAGQTLFLRGQPIKAEALALRLPSYGMSRDGRGRHIPVVQNAFVTLDKEGTQPLRLGVR